MDAIKCVRWTCAMEGVRTEPAMRVACGHCHSVLQVFFFFCITLKPRVE